MTSRVRSSLLPERPRSPLVAVTTYVSTPSAAYLAKAPPMPRDSSSGWARTHINLKLLGAFISELGATLRVLLRRPLDGRRGLQIDCSYVTFLWKLSVGGCFLKGNRDSHERGRN